MNLAKLGINLVRRQKRYERRKEKLQAEIDRMVKKHHAVSFKSAVLEPIAKAILRELTGYKSYKVLGPFGLCCEFSVSFYKTAGEHDSDAECLNLSFVDFDHENGKLYIRDYSRTKGNFAKNSVGEINGMNYERVEVPPDADAKWFVDLLVALRLRNSA